MRADARHISPMRGRPLPLAGTGCIVTLVRASRRQRESNARLRLRGIHVQVEAASEHDSGHLAQLTLVRKAEHTRRVHLRLGSRLLVKRPARARRKRRLAARHEPDLGSDLHVAAHIVVVRAADFRRGLQVRLGRAHESVPRLAKRDLELRSLDRTLVDIESKRCAALECGVRDNARGGSGALEVVVRAERRERVRRVLE
mmetsp:Transcript_4959/g.12785  ORF Transcript_4959/g.12785 Transcript_4959/m.12785 type:complete len:200 (+) Transcript_4959:269-868(+)